MTVGHTKFSPDRIFGAIRQRMSRSSALLSEEFRKLVIDAADCSEAHIFDHVNYTRDSNRDACAVQESSRIQEKFLLQYYS